MRVFHVALTSISGNSAAWRIRAAQESVGCEAVAAVHVPGDNLYSVKISALNRWSLRLLDLLDRLPLEVCRSKKKLPWHTGLWGSNIQLVKQYSPDIINLHWVSGGCVNLDSLNSFAQPLVWTMHDVWGVTAGCHCNLGCKLWEDGCHNCPQLGPSLLPDFSHTIWKVKQARLNRISNLCIVTPSRWLKNIVERSPLHKGRKVICIPNPIDLDLYTPLPKEVSRDQLNIPYDEKVILFSAAGGVKVGYKGFDLLIEALQKLSKILPHKIRLLVIGEPGQFQDNYPFPVTSLGAVTDEQVLVFAYNAADVFASPSRQDNYPNAVLEAMSCGLPTVGFAVGGVPEIIEHKNRGYVADAFDIDDFAAGLRFVLTHSNPKFLSDESRHWALTELSFSKVGKEYCDFYETLL